ncbi:MAG: hypothetical protein ACTSRI_00290 [Promethearchaeota archaeon]
MVTIEKILLAYEEKARKRQLKQFKDKPTDVNETIHNGEKGLSGKIVAEKVNIGINKIYKAKKVQ